MPHEIFFGTIVLIFISSITFEKLAIVTYFREKRFRATRFEYFIILSARWLVLSESDLSHNLAYQGYCTRAIHRLGAPLELRPGLAPPNQT